MNEVTNLDTYTFEWDDEKARKNKEKHGISFELAGKVFANARERRAYYGYDL